jgi:[NiFe] hydrogenase assembly HybE family chaperone
LANAFRAAAARMEGLSFVNPVLAVEAVGFAPWQGHWLGVMLTPWFMNLVLAPRDASVWRSLPQGETQCYRFPAGDFDFIGARDELAGDYQLCSLFSPVLQFDDQPSARMVAQLARDALFDTANAEPGEMPVANLSPASDAGPANPGPLPSLAAPQSKRDFLRGRLSGDDRADRR